MPVKNPKVKEESPERPEDADFPASAPGSSRIMEPFTDPSTPKEVELARYHRTLLTMIGHDRQRPRMLWCIPLILGGASSGISIPQDSIDHLRRFTERNGGTGSWTITEAFRKKPAQELREMGRDSDVIDLCEVDEFREVGKHHVGYVHDFLRRFTIELLLEMTDMSLEQRDELERMTREQSSVFSNPVFIRDIRPRDVRESGDQAAKRKRKEEAYERMKQQRK